MKNYILFFSLIFIANISYSQDFVDKVFYYNNDTLAYKRPTNSFIEKINKTSPILKEHFIGLNKYLDNCQLDISMNNRPVLVIGTLSLSQQLKDIENYIINESKKYKNRIDFEVYRKELAFYSKADVIIKNKEIQERLKKQNNIDSLNRAYIDSVNKKNNAEFEKLGKNKIAKQDRLYSIRRVFNHPYGALFIGEDYNDANMQLTQFIQSNDYINLYLKGSEHFNGGIRSIYETRSGEVKQLITDYYIDDNMIISKVEIYGFFDLAAKLFVEYWPSEIRLSDLSKKTIAECQTISDYIKLNSSLPNGKIVITGCK